ncbi:phage holin family protein [Methanobacterium alcaliphilum]|uniref:phage holin family protein n=1 Tax=Methanobacterium alcaliphilum TaxID=392018 RepID=UPI002009DFEA|nr:phage holin family protein [Methanobacterium alcaliphilum]MCK9152322.1 phage holin family protein [Methanobacterium alcaliphilum]
MKNYNPLYNPKKQTVYGFIGRTLILWVGEVLGFILIAHLSVGLTINDWETAVVVVSMLGVINALFWPFLSRIFLPFLVYTVGIGALIINGILIWAISNFVPGIRIEGWALILTPLSMAIITTILSILITLDDDTSYYRAVLRRNIKNKHKKPKDYPGILFLEIDGLSETILKEAIEKGHMPTLARWLKDGIHKIIPWETDLSSQTGASQAGILHGNNKDLPAFRWVEKTNNNKIMVSTGLSDAPVIEKRISDGKGLLASNGASRSNLFSGDAENVIFTYSKLKKLSKFYNETWYYFFSNPSNFGRMLTLFFFDAGLDMFSQVAHWYKDIRPRIKRGFIYAFVRAGANVFLREITTYTLIGDMLASDIDIAYSTYLGYDEIAHHSGIRDSDAFHALQGLDKQFKRLENASKYTKRPYYFVVQSDHGQSNGATFKQRYGMSLEDLVQKLLPEEINVYSQLSSNEDHFSQAITGPFDSGKVYIKDKKDYAVGKSRKVVDTTLDSIKKSSIAKGKVLEYIKDYEVSRKPVPKNGEDAEVIVLASGNLGLIYLTQWKERLSYEDIKTLFPDLIPGLVQHEGIGFIMVFSKQWGPMAIGRNGVYYLESGKIDGENPLKPFGENASSHLLRSSTFEYAPDIMVNSFYDSEKDEVAAFEELVGSHGGLGGGQSKPFIMFPTTWELEVGEIVGAEELHRILKNKIREIQKKN